MGVRQLQAPRLAALVLLLLVAAPARAAEEGLQIFPDWKLWVLLGAFVVLVPVLDHLLFRPLFRVLDERTARIEGARRQAAELASEADGLHGRYETALREARAEAESERKGRLAEAREEQTRIVTQARERAEGELERTRRDVVAAAESARGTLRAAAQPLAREMAERLLGRKLA